MSAILFSQEDTQSKCDGGSNHFVDAAAFVDERVCNSGQQSLDICEELLGSKMSSLDLNDVAKVLQTQPSNFEGSDSGVDVATIVSASAAHSSGTLQRALSSNSGGYTSSNGGLEEHTNTHGVNMSCDSSVVSGSSDFGEQRAHVTSEGTVEGGSRSNEIREANSKTGSENGSESSSVTGHITTTPRGSLVRRKVAMFEPCSGGYSAGSVGGVVSGTATPNTKAAPKLKEFKAPSAPGPGQPDTPNMRPRSSTLKRTASLPRPSSQATLQIRNSKHQVSAAAGVGVSPGTSAMSMSFRGTPTRGTKQPPDSLPSSLSRTQSMSMQRLVQRTPSLSRARTPCTPSDDGRWPSVSANVMGRTMSTKRGSSVTPDAASLKTRSILTLGCANPYSTLPRRRKQKSVEDLTGGQNSRSSSISRDSRMTSSVMGVGTRRNLVNSYGASVPPTTVLMPAKKMPPNPRNLHISPTTSTTGTINSRRAAQQSTQKTRIYHETGVQTALTSVDLEIAFSGGCSAVRPVDAAEQRDQQTQADIRDSHERELERLREEVRQLTHREHELGNKLQREREEKLSMQRELHLNTERVMAMLEMARLAGGSEVVGDGHIGTPNSDDSGGHDSLLMLESQIQMSGHELIERQQEIGQLRQLCRSLQFEMERSLAAQECLLQEKATIEQESNELQDFLQHEKTAMYEAFKELEAEYQTCKQQLESRGEEVKVLRDECRHLVRLNEQRRQENRTLQTKFVALESKSKELLAQQNSSVSAASVSLTGLHTRLDSLVERLVSSYNISEQDLEDIGFQSDMQTNSGSSGNCEDFSQDRPIINGLDVSSTSASHQHLHQQLLPQPSDGSLSPQRNQSFLAAVISAIRHATTPAGKRLLARNNKRSGGSHSANVASNSSNNNHKHEPANNGDDSDSTEMLDSETEPCLMMDNVLEDVTMPDSHSHNMVSSSCTGMISQIELPSELLNASTGDESLHNLSLAITNRQQMELHVSAMYVQKAVGLPLNGQHLHDNSASEDVSCHDSVAEIPSLIEYCCSTQAVVDQVIEVDSLVTKLLKVLRLIQMDNDSCIQQLIVDKNKLQQTKEDMLEKMKDLEDVNVKLQDELMDATQELMLKNNDLSNTKAEMQRHRNEIDRLTEDICNLSTLCSNYRKLSPTTEFSPMQRSPDALVPTADGNDEVLGILNLLKMWNAEGHLKDKRVRAYFHQIYPQQPNTREVNERVRIYANQLEHILTVLSACDHLESSQKALQQLRQDVEVVKLNANWTHILTEAADGDNERQPAEHINTSAADENANAACTEKCEWPGNLKGN